MLVRLAAAPDAGAICDVLRRSITELCVADHRHEPAILGAWLANKTPATVARWIADPDGRMFVAVDGTTILGVAAVTIGGEITLNYVAPDARFRGVSMALMAQVEQIARELGHAQCTLLSTQTAHRFYLARGYRDSGPPTAKFGSLSYPMVKPVGSA